MHGLSIIDELTARHPAIGITLLTLHLKQPDYAFSRVNNNKSTSTVTSNINGRTLFCDEKEAKGQFAGSNEW